MQPLGSDDGKARVRVAEYEHSVRPRLGEELVGAVDDVPACGSEVVTDGVHIDLRLGEFEILEEYAVEVVVVVLARVGEDHVKIFTALGDDGSEADNLGAGAHHYYQLQLAVLLEMYV